jgi:hypothetical protein
MRIITTLILMLIVSACSTGSGDKARTSEVPEAIFTVTYYDRNLDGVADLELHEPAYCDDCDWALVDTNFDGRYDKRVRWSFGIVKEVVDLPVPNNVDLVLGIPQRRGWE